MIIKEMSISEIKIEDSSRITTKDIQEHIIQSIEKHGIKNPPILFKSKKQYILLSGFRRIDVLKKLKRKKTFFIIEDKDFSLKDRLFYTLNENLATRKLTLYEKFIFLKKIKNIDYNEFKNYKKTFGFENIDDKVFSFIPSEPLSFLLENEKLSPKTLKLLLLIDKEKREPFLHTFKSLSFTHSEINEALSLILRAYEMKKEFNIKACKSKIDFFNALKKTVFPLTESLKKRFDEIKKEFKGFKLKHKPYFESLKIELSFEFEDFDELLDKAEKLKNIFLKRKGKWHT